jgi:hypothetical protein
LTDKIIKIATGLAIFLLFSFFIPTLFLILNYTFDKYFPRIDIIKPKYKLRLVGIYSSLLIWFLSFYVFNIFFLLSLSYIFYFDNDQYYSLMIKILIAIITIVASLSGLSFRASSSNIEIDKKEMFYFIGENLFLATLLEIFSLANLLFFHENLLPSFSTITILIPIKSFSIYIGTALLVCGNVIAGASFIELIRYFFSKRYISMKEYYKNQL